MLAALGGLSLTVIASGVSIVFDIHRISVLDRSMSDAARGSVTRLVGDLAAARSSDHETAVIAIVEVATLVIAATTFIAWFHRAYANLPKLGAGSTRFGPGWAIGGWFVPILSFWRPKQIANEIYRSSDPDRLQEPETQKGPLSPLLWFWWTAWIVTWVLNRAAAGEWSAANSLRALRSAAGMDIASESMSIIAASLAIAVVYSLTGRENRRAGAVAASGPPVLVG
jgi:hypothetical protein